MSRLLGAKALILSPVGRTYFGDHVEWYPQTQGEIEAGYFNIGDMVVYDSTLKLLSCSHVEPVSGVNPTQQEIEHYRTHDFFLVRGSNFIHNKMDWHQTLELLEAVPLPVFAIGVGGQSSDGLPYALTGPNLRFWRTVAERSTVIGVRGSFTAALLAHNGITNVEIVGCPSLFRGRDRNLAITANPAPRRVAFSIRREADGSYATRVAEYRAAQRDLLLRFARHCDIRVTIHGEPEEKAFYYRNRDRMAAARKIFLEQGWWTPETQAEMEAIYRDRLFFFLKPADYDEFIRTQDLAIGYRVHGVLPALANGRPGILVTHDSRGAELAETHGFPAIRTEDAAAADIDRLLAETSFETFNRGFAKGYDTMRRVLDRNGLQHRMG